MKIEYKDEKIFTKEQVQELFLSVNWESGQFPQRLYKALMNSSTVITAWDGGKLVGLVRVLDDTEMVAFLHYLVVNPEYQGYGVGKRLVDMVKEKYKDYFYIKLMVPKKKPVHFYEKCGFIINPEGTYMQIINDSNKK